MKAIPMATPARMAKEGASFKKAWNGPVKGNAVPAAPMAAPQGPSMPMNDADAGGMPMPAPSSMVMAQKPMRGTKK